MTALPARTAIADPATTNAQARIGFGDIYDYLSGLFGTDGTTATAQTTLGIATQLQNPTSNQATTTGTPPAYQATLTPAPASLTTGLRLRLQFHAAGAGVDTLNVNALGSVGLRQYDNTGAKVPAVLAAGQLADVEYDGLDWVVLDPLPVVPDSVPAGAIQHFALATAPTGWLPANGAAVSRTAYAALFAAIGTVFGVGDGSTTFGLPDLRGEFLRGWDAGRGVDAGRVLGSGQVHATEGLYAQHQLQPTEFVRTVTTPSWTPNLFMAAGSGVLAGTATQGLGVAALGTGSTHPRNVALLACIKY